MAARRGPCFLSEEGRSGNCNKSSSVAWCSTKWFNWAVLCMGAFACKDTIFTSQCTDLRWIVCMITATMCKMLVTLYILQIDSFQSLQSCDDNAGQAPMLINRCLPGRYRLSVSSPNQCLHIEKHATHSVEFTCADWEHWQWQLKMSVALL